LPGSGRRPGAVALKKICVATPTTNTPKMRASSALGSLSASQPPSSAPGTSPGSSRRTSWPSTAPRR
jgi:hypothetical protein